MSSHLTLSHPNPAAGSAAQSITENSKVVDGVDVKWTNKFVVREADKFDLVPLHDLALVIRVVHNSTGVSYGLCNRFQ